MKPYLSIGRKIKIHYADNNKKPDKTWRDTEGIVLCFGQRCGSPKNVLVKTKHGKVVVPMGNIKIIKTTCVTGHRPHKFPKELFGYNYDNIGWKKLSEILANTIEDLIKKYDVNEFISGGALGVDQVFFLTVHSLKKKYPKIKNIIAVPFRSQDKSWSTDSKKIYASLLKMADEVIVVSEGDYKPWKMQKRNQYMVDNSDIVIAVHDGSTGGTANLVNYAMKKNKKIIRINPKEIEI